MLFGWSVEDVLTVLRATFDTVEVLAVDAGRSLVFLTACIA